MSQFDFGTIDPNSKSGPQLALDLNKFRDALNSGHRGSTRPAYAQAGMQWVRETSSTQWDLMFFDGDTDFVIRSVNPASNTLLNIPSAQVQGLDSSLALSIKKDSASTTGAAILPAGTTAQRPAAPSNGMLRYNTTTGEFEGYQGGAWVSIISTDPWALQPIGVPIPILYDISGNIPPANKDYRYIKLTASDSYNNGLLVSEVVSGTAPLVVATATISLAGSPLNDVSVNLINTERRVLRGGSVRVVEQDSLQNITGIISGQSLAVISTTGYLSGAFATNGNTSSSRPSPATAAGYEVSFDASRVARTSTETRPKNIGVTYYMRIK